MIAIISGFFIPTAATYAASAIHTLGYAPRTAGYWPHGIQVGVKTLLSKDKA